MSQNNNNSTSEAGFASQATVTGSDASLTTLMTPARSATSVSATPISQSPGRIINTSNLRSFWWRFFTRREHEDGKHRAECKHCTKCYLAKNGVISSMKAHVVNKHSEELSRADDPEGAITSEFSQENFVKDISEWISGDCLVFNTIQSPRFKRMIANLSSKATIPSPKKFKRILEEVYVEKRQELKDRLAGAPGNISLTIDVWTSRMQDSYLGVTAHWLDSKCVPDSSVLDIASFPGSHSGKNIAAELKKVCEEYDILNRIQAITCDNASNNIALFKYFVKHVSDAGGSFIEERGHIRCVAHVMNLSIQKLLNGLGVDVPESEAESESESINSDNDNDEVIGELEDILAERLVGSPITHTGSRAEAGSSASLSSVAKIRLLVNSIRKSPKRLNELKRTCEREDIRYLALITDSPTRWNSTYAMVCRALMLMKALRSMCLSDWALHSFSLTEQEWKELEIVTKILKPFEKALQSLCGDKNMTMGLAVPA